VNAPAAAHTAGRLRALLVALCAALALVVAGNSALAIALPDIAADLGADQAELTWIVDAYALTFAALLLPAGIAADRVGRRTVIVAGLVVFGGAGVASAFAPDPATLIALRAVAGVGAAAVFPVTLSALVDAYPEERRGVAVAAWSAVSAAGAVAGTLVAGALLEVLW
jgi:MFS family permease